MTNRAIAAAAYRKEVAAAIAFYHESVGRVWRMFGRPVACPLCADELQQCWKRLKADLQQAGATLDRTPVVLSQQENINNAEQQKAA
jgi:hypothetical protein